MNSAKYQVGFLLEQTLGHRTHTQNLQANVPHDPSIVPYWGLIPWETTGLASYVPLYNRNWTVRASLRARRLIADFQQQTTLDALFIHTQVAAILASDWLRRIPSIVSLDATPLQYDTLGAHYAHQTHSRWIEKQKRQLYRKCFGHAQRLVTWSHWAKLGLIEEYAVPAEKITVIPPGVPVRTWQRATQRPQERDVLKILFVGGDFQRKGGQLLLDAFRILRGQNSYQQRIELHVVTQQQLPSESQVFVYNNLSPNSPALKALFHDCDIFALPTAGDCLPMVLSEAGAAGLPLIATNVGAIAEIVQPEFSGFLIDVNDRGSLVEKLRYLLDNPSLRQTMGQNAFALVSDTFDAEANTMRLLTEIKEVADRQSWLTRQDGQHSKWQRAAQQPLQNRG